MVGIAGGSGSGKTTFARKIFDRTRSASRGGAVALLAQDSYYLTDPAGHLRLNGSTNFDHPEAFDWGLMREHLRELKSGRKIHAPTYDYRSSRRREETHEIGPARVLFFEGLYALWDPGVRDLLDLKVFLAVDSDIRFIRRLHRDIRERDRSIDDTIKQYYDTVRPMHREFVEPTRQFADLIVGEDTDIASDVVAARARQALAPQKPTAPRAE